MRDYLMKLIIVLLIGYTLTGCTPLGKAEGAFTETCITATPSTSEIDISKYAGQEVTIRFSHEACTSNCDAQNKDNSQKVYLEDIEFIVLDANGNPITPEKTEEFGFDKTITDSAIRDITNSLTSKGISNLKVYPLKDKVVVEYLDSDISRPYKLRINTALIMALTLTKFPYASFIEVHHFKGTESPLKAINTNTEIINSLSNPVDFRNSLVFEPLMPEEVLTK